MKIIILIILLTSNNVFGCDSSQTTASGTAAPTKICSGDMIFEETFDTFDHSIWQHENTLAGGGNWEFQWYTNNRSNSYVENGILYIRPTLTSDTLGEAALSSATLNLHGGAPADQCTNPSFYGCERIGTAANILNPIKSARIRTVESFTFRYGKIEVRAKMPAGDWLWPAIWLMPKLNAYGTWPASGEIDLVESRGNRNLTKNGTEIGTQQIGSTLHFGPYPGLNRYETAHFTRSLPSGWNTDFHRYQMDWTPSQIIFSVDDVETGSIDVDDGFWKHGDFDSIAPGTENPWKYGTLLAPFDQEFYLIMNNAVGGISYFPDDAINENGKPWLNTSPTALRDFWKGRTSWLSTWNLDVDFSKEASLQVDYVRVWAL